MSQFDANFNVTPNAPEDKSRQSMSKEEFAARMKQQRQDAFDQADEMAISCSMDDAALKSYLDVLSSFPKYSVNNLLLVASQMPEATELHDFDYWQEHNARVNKGAHGITIIEPGKSYTRADGSEGVSYDPKKVFDISQTSAAKEQAPREVRDERILMRALLDKAQVAVKAVENMPEGVLYAYYIPEKNTILAKNGTEVSAIFPMLARELAVAELGGQRQEVLPIATCAARVVCQRCGMDTSFESNLRSKDMDEWDLAEIKADLGRIKEAADSITNRMERNLSPEKKPHKVEFER